MIDAKPDWTRRTVQRLWDKYGVQPIGLDEQLERLYRQRKSPREAVNAIGTQFNLQPVSTWKGGD